MVWGYRNGGHPRSAMEEAKCKNAAAAVLRALFCSFVLVSISCQAVFAQAQPVTRPVNSAPFTQQELRNLWQHTYATPQLLTSVDDFTRTMPICFDSHEILRANSSEVLATLKPMDVFLGPGPGPGPTGGWDIIYVFQVNFLNRPHNLLYKYWVRDFPADYMPVQNIPQISILTGVTKDQSGAPAFDYGDAPGFGILVSSEKDPAPQNYDDLMVFNNYGFSLGDENSSASSKCK